VRASGKQLRVVDVSTLLLEGVGETKGVRHPCGTGSTSAR
jgi:hypothetical protein